MFVAVGFFVKSEVEIDAFAEVGKGNGFEVVNRAGVEFSIGDVAEVENQAPTLSRSFLALQYTAAIGVEGIFFCFGNIDQAELEAEDVSSEEIVLIESSVGGDPFSDDRMVFVTEFPIGIELLLKMVFEFFRVEEKTATR